MRHAARVDANHAAVVEAFRAFGCSVQSLAAVGHGVPDLLIGYHGQTHLVEVKDGDRPPSERRLTTDQIAFAAVWSGEPVEVVESIKEALGLLKIWGMG